MITEFNKAMEESGTRMEKIKMIVMKEAEAMIASLEDAEARRQEELVMRKNKLIERLTSDLEATGQLEEELRSRGVGGNERKRWTFPPEDPEQKALKKELGLEAWIGRLGGQAREGEKTELKSGGDSGRGTGPAAAGGSSRELFKSLEEALKIQEPTVTRGEKEDTGSVTPEKVQEARQKMILLEMEEEQWKRKEKERLREEQIARQVAREEQRMREKKEEEERLAARKRLEELPL